MIRPLLTKPLAVVLVALFASVSCSRNSEPAGTATGAAVGTPEAPYSPSAPETVSGHGMTVRVLLGQAMVGKADPRDTVHIYARSPEPNGQIIALVKRQASELPVTVTLDDTASLRSNLRLSTVPTVVIGARISKQDDPTPRPGDLEGTSAPIPVNIRQTVVVAVSRVR